MKAVLFILTSLLIGSLLFSCTKSKTDSCSLGACDQNRKTLLTISNETGNMFYYDEVKSWAVNIHTPGTIDDIKTCILCGDFADSLKVKNKLVVLSGALKESCDKPAALLGGQQIFYVQPTSIK